MNILGWQRRKEFTNLEAKAYVQKGKSLAETEIKMIDENNGTHSFDSNWAMKLRNKRKAIDMEFYRTVKRALKLKSEGIFYKSERQIAKNLQTSETTVTLIRRASSFKNYQTLRWVTSRGHGKDKVV